MTTARTERLAAHEQFAVALAATDADESVRRAHTLGRDRYLLTQSWTYDYETDRCLGCGHDTWAHEPDGVCRICQAITGAACAYRSGAEPTDITPSPPNRRGVLRDVFHRFHH